MKQTPVYHIFCLFLLLSAMPVGQATAGTASLPPEVAASQSELLKPPGITGGLCVHLGCGDGQRTVALARDGRFLVHGLDADPKKVEETRTRIKAANLSEKVFAEHFVSERLPYATHLVNQIVAEDPGKVTRAEMLRVLRPLGIAYIKTKEGWRKMVKPWPKEMDEWTHPLHGPDGNAASYDTALGVPNALQWMGGFKSPFGESRDNENRFPMVTARGRSFYSNGIMVDSFNGLPLWSKEIERALLVVGDSAYVQIKGSLKSIDAATGKEQASFELSGTAEQVLIYENILIAGEENAITAFKADSGKQLWSKKTSKARHLVAGNGQLYFVNGDTESGTPCTIEAVDIVSGKTVWSKNHTWGSNVLNCSYRDGLLAYGVGGGVGIVAIWAKDGSEAWQYKYKPGHGSMFQKDLVRGLFVGDYLWPNSSGKNGQGLDPKTGKPAKKIPIKGGGGRCWLPVATERFWISQYMTFTDFESGTKYSRIIARPSCKAGAVPANGMFYTFGASYCKCRHWLSGVMAICHREPIPGSPLLEPGPAAGQATAVVGEVNEEWPLYRHDAWRSGASTTTVGSALHRVWSSDVSESGRAISPPTVAADGMVFVTEPDTHRVYALDALKGKPRWSFTANGRVDLPPTIHQGLCLFGTRSGWVYALSAKNRALVWRFRAGPVDRRIVAYDQLESVWPIPGSVLAKDGNIYFSAGRSPLTDEGLHVYGLEAGNGQLLWEQRITDRPDGRGRTDSFVDILALDGKDKLTMTFWRLDKKTGNVRLANAEKIPFNKRKQVSIGPQTLQKIAPYQAGPTGMAFPVGVWAYSQRSLAMRENSPMLAVCSDTTLFFSNKRGLKASGGQRWKSPDIVSARAMVVTKDVLFACNKEGTKIFSISLKDGKVLSEYPLPAPAVWDGMAAAYGKLFVCTEKGSVICLSGDKKIASNSHTSQ